MNLIKHNPSLCGVFLLAAMVPLSANAQAQPQRHGLPAPKESVLPSEPVEVVMHRFDRLPAVDATINGRGPFRLIVDTGAAGVILKRELAEALKLPAPPGLPEGLAKVQLASPGGPVPGSLGYIETLKVGGAVFQGIWTVGVALPYGDDLDGIIGMNVFTECLLTYDYPGNRIRLTQGELPQANGGDILTFTTPESPGSHPVIELNAGGEVTPFTIDTGMRGWFAMPSELVQKFVILDGPVSGMRSLAVGGTSERQLARLGTTIALGHFTVEKPLVSFEGEDGGVLLGKGTVVGTLLLEHFVVTFDVRHNRVRFSRESRVPITPPTLRMLGLGMRRSGDSMEVWAVHPNSNAKSLGVLEGSLVHEINGRPAIALYGTSEWDDLLETADKITLRFAPPGGDAAQTVAVEVLKLLPSARGETGETAGG